MLALSGLTLRDALQTDGDIEICITGLRPGEKLYEELLIGDNPEPTEHPRILRAHEEHLAWVALSNHLQELIAAARLFDNNRMLMRLRTLVPGFQPDDTLTVAGCDRSTAS
jgi:FlaA1/EpsC-like NDP-sugar epimerase